MDTPPPDYFAGLDLGQTQDPTAFVLVERTRRGDLPVYAVRHLERFHLGTAYPAIVERMKTITGKPPLRGQHLAVDQTGVGRPVVDMLRAAGLPVKLWPITITHGLTVALGPAGERHVPKKDLVAVVQLLLQSRRLLIARSLPQAALLQRELETFKVKITANANESFEAWREKDHDDMVLALSTALWVAERGAQPFVVHRVAATPPAEAPTNGEASRELPPEIYWRVW
jgi:hypothetical protein